MCVRDTCRVHMTFGSAQAFAAAVVSLTHSLADGSLAEHASFRATRALLLQQVCTQAGVTDTVSDLDA